MALVACHAPLAPPVDPPPVDPLSTSAPRVETREVQLADGLITVRLHIPQTSESKKPTVIVMEGHTAFLERGWLAATYRINWEFLKPPLPPLPDPGATGAGKWVLASPSAEILGEQYFRTIAIIANVVIPKIVQFLQTVPEVDPHRLGVVGGSTNGLVILQALTRTTHITAAVAMAACGDYHRFLQYSSMGMNGAPLTLSPAYEHWLSRQEPIRRPRRWLRAAVLMVNRQGDPIVPIECADATSKIVAPTYHRAGLDEHFRYRVLEGNEHGLAQPELDEMFAWLERWLRPASRTGRRHRSETPPR